MRVEHVVQAADMDKLVDLIGDAELTSSLTESQLSGALQGAVVPTVVTDPLTGDVSVIYPGDDRYTPTYDYHFAAYVLVDLLASKPVVTSASSEGSSITAQAPNWDALRSYFKSGSLILNHARSVFDILDLPAQSRVQRNWMNDVGGYHGDIDTDIN